MTHYLLCKYIDHCKISDDNNGFIGCAEYIYDDMDNTMEDDEAEGIQESIKNSSKYTIVSVKHSGSDQVRFNIMVQWDTRSSSTVSIPNGLVKFLVNEFDLYTHTNTPLQCYTEYSRVVDETKYIFRCHPKYKSKGA